MGRMQKIDACVCSEGGWIFTRKFIPHGQELSLTLAGGKTKTMRGLKGYEWAHFWKDVIPKQKQVQVSIVFQQHTKILKDEKAINPVLFCFFLKVNPG